MSILQDIFGDHYEEMIYTLHPRQSVIENVDKMNLYAMQRTTSMSFKLVNAPHCHCVFTIDEQPRDFFLNDRSLPDCLFHAVNSAISRLFFKQNKRRDATQKIYG